MVAGRQLAAFQQAHVGEGPAICRWVGAPGWRKQQAQLVELDRDKRPQELISLLLLALFIHPDMSCEC